ncbi:MAG: hypothetical protein KKA59_08425 [Candidatus Omnitrophica bacterium]|nr:hypothetical protein [Candidatus Omnitrophota bacterium]
MKSKIPDGYVSTAYFVDFFNQSDLTYRNVTFYRQSGVFPQPIRVKGHKEKYWNLDFMKKRLQTIYVLGRCLDFSIDQIRIFINRNKDPEHEVESILDSMDKLNRNNIMKIGDMIYLIWAASLREGVDNPIFTVKMANLTAISFFWHIKGIPLEKHVLLQKFIRETYNIINQNVDYSENNGIAAINEMTKEIREKA